MSDLLEKATRALRETSAEPQPKSGLTRARILESAEKRDAGRRNFGLKWIIAIAATLAASTALARVAQYWPEIKRALTPAAEEAPAPAKQAAKRKHKAEAVQKPPELPPSAAAVLEPMAAPEPSVEPPAPATPMPARASAKGVRRLEPEPVAVVPAPDPVRDIEVRAPAPLFDVKRIEPAPESAELALFRRAQRLHRAQDPRALAAWDGYLRVATERVLVPEARYNRALVLVRLGRKEDARRALAPFAVGEYGNYRRAEAKALMDALESTH